MTLPRHFLHHWLWAFQKSRIDNHRMVTGFVERLEGTLPVSGRPIHRPSEAFQMGGGWRSSPEARRSLWQTLKMAWQERRYLHRQLSDCRLPATWLIADDRRSGLIQDWKDLADQLRIFGGQLAPPWLARWQEEGQRLVCFTPNLIALRPTDSRGTVHLSYLSLFAVPLAWPRAYSVAFVRMLFNQPLWPWARRNAWITTMLAAAMEVMLVQQAPSRLLMITSNSFVIELMRYMYAVSGKGEGVTEVLHGVPSLELEAYHKDMIAFSNQKLSGRVRLVPPVPGLRVNNAAGHVLIDTHTVNLKMNAVSRQRDLAALADECVQRDVARGGIPVITLNGAGTVEGRHYLETGCFAAEQAIVQLVLSKASGLGLKVHVQYSLHPAHIKSGDAQAIAQALAVYGVEVLDDSLQSWLESDLCISILSSASWDALALGCQVVIGVSPDDQLYSNELLEPLLHPTGEYTLPEVVSGAIARMTTHPRAVPHDRVAMITGNPRSSEWG